MATHNLTSPENGWVDPRGAGNTASAMTDALVDNDSLDAALVTAGYSQKRIDQMTQNDKVYALRLELDSAGF